jgi:hypothetical protein
MGIEISSEFDVQTALPIDSRFVVADLTARDAIPALRRYEGLICYVEAEETNYQLVGGIADGDWAELSGSGGGGGILSVADLTARDAIDVGDRYEGLIAYVVSEQKNYQLIGGTTNGDWTLLYSEGGTGFFDVVTRVYSAFGTATWNKPSGLLFVEVEVVGAGGGGGGVAANTTSGAVSLAGGGGGGAYSRKRVSAGDLGSSETVTVGAGGAGGSSGGGNGGDGTDSSFGTHCVAGGGAGAVGVVNTVAGMSAPAGGAGGAAGAGDISIPGEIGERGPGFTTAGLLTTRGGRSFFGNPARGAQTSGSGTTANGTSATIAHPGVGGGGGFAHRAGSNLSASGAIGRDGIVIVREYIMTGVWAGVSPVKTVADLVERDAIDSGDRFEGLVVYVISEGRNYQLVGGTTNSDWVIFGSIFGGTGTGGGGGSIELFAGDDPAPVEVVKYGIKCLEFEAGASQHILFSYQVPAGYIAGNQIRLFAKFFSAADDSGTALLEADTSLREDGDVLSSPSSNIHASTNTAIAQDVVDEQELVEIDLTDGSGEINSVAVVPGDLLVVDITRGTDTAEEAVYLIKGSLEVRIG